METTFSENQEVLCGEYIGTIKTIHPADVVGMAEVRLESGLVCVAMEELKPLTPPQIRRLWRDGGELIIESFDEREAIIAEMNTAKGNGRIPVQDSAIADRIVNSYNDYPNLLDLAAETLAEWHLKSSNMEKIEPPRIKAIRESKVYEQIRQAAMIKIAKAQK